MFGCFELGPDETSSKIGIYIFNKDTEIGKSIDNEKRTVLQ